ncbi:hypothetical protein [Saccharopolyspora gloriosae]|uniref:hypothetical protein n=1 Tax=Saccharopolyspora gloriosae TaxID=455344 RepID=UPI001FB59F13|nr:hypothetical protein [Saccharopolyspora gloriosae]
MRTALLCLAACALAGCSATPQAPPRQQQIREYFAVNNAAARQGPQAQQDFFGRTQHPDYTDLTCELDGITVELDPALSTLRPDPAYAPDSTGPPRGEVWAIGVEVTVRHEGTITGRQIGSQHLVLLDGRVHGFAPCPNESGS